MIPPDGRAGLSLRVRFSPAPLGKTPANCDPIGTSDEPFLLPSAKPSSYYQYRTGQLQLLQPASVVQRLGVVYSACPQSDFPDSPKFSEGHISSLLRLEDGDKKTFNRRTVKSSEVLEYQKVVHPDDQQASGSSFMQKETDLKVYEFSGFRLEGNQRRLLYKGQPVPLKSKILDLLLYLVQRRGELVVKDDLMREIWPDAIVEENNITVSMSILRKTLGDRMDQQFIETIPRQGYRFVADVTEVLLEMTARGTGPIALSTAVQEELIDSLAVIPTESPGDDPNVEYLSDGITESIINMLSRIPKLRVLACSTVFRFKRKNLDPKEVGLQLNVRAVMMIRVLRLGEKLIIRSELVKVSDGSQLWGEQYNRSPSDILAVQDEIAKAISENLKFTLSSHDQVRLTEKATANIEAYNLYLRGRYFWNRYSKEWVLKAVEAFKQAILIDSQYALAYSGIADAYFRLSNVYSSPAEVLPKAKDAALRAVEIDDNLAEAHSSLGLVKVYYDHDWVGAESEFRKALKLNPQLLSAHQRLGSYLTFRGRFEEALRYYESALDFDPFSLQVNMNIATTYFLRGEYERSLNHLAKTIELEPNYMPIHFLQGCNYIEQNRLPEAIAEFQFIYKLDEEAYLALGFMGYAHALAGQRAEAETLLNILEEISTRKYVSPYSMLVIHLALGPRERVFEILEQLYEDRNDWLVWLKVSPELKSLRPDPRFKNLLRRIGFPE
jgi:DNA-binding winged helix-turn-helix (wHTH) protein/tetratricopeptide (TPR) repeat protein